MVKTYAPGQVSVIFGPVIMSGFAKGTFVTAEREEQPFKQETGVDGEATRVKSGNLSGKVTVTLQQTSQTNALLSVLHEADMIGNAGVYPMTIKDNNGADLCFSPAAYLDGPPKIAFSDGVEGREWTLLCGVLSIFAGGTENTTVG